MNDLIDLVDLVKKSKFKSIGLMGLLLEKDSQMERLFEGIAKGDIRTDEALISAFPEFGGSLTRMATLKSKLKDRLLDSVLLLDLGETVSTDRQKAYHECHRKYAAAMILLAKGLRSIGIETLETLQRKNLRFEFTEMSIEVLRTLSQNYAFIEGEKKKYDEVEALLTQQEEVYKKERNIEHLYKDLTADFVRKKGDKRRLRDKAAEYLQQIKPLLDQCSSYWVQLLGRLMEIMLYDTLGDQAEVARLSEAGILFFEQKPYSSTSAFQAFHNYLFAALLSLRQYERCQALIDQYGERFEAGAFNWFKRQELQFLKATYTSDYENARNIFAQTILHSKFTEQSPPIWEIWKIFEAYIAFLVKVGAMPPDTNSSMFKVGKFVNEIQVYSHDKRGMNIHIILLQFLFELINGNYEKCTGRLDALAKYRQRYLTDPACFRSHSFILMLEQIPKSSYQKGLVEDRTIALLEALQAQSPELSNRNYEIEIIPYETIWALVLHSLPVEQKNITINKSLKNMQIHIL